MSKLVTLNAALAVTLAVRLDAGAVARTAALESALRGAINRGLLDFGAEADVCEWTLSVTEGEASDAQAVEHEVGEWVARLEGADVDSDALDDTVHDIASSVGSTVNNGGLRAQVRFVLDYGSESQLRAALAAAEADVEVNANADALPACLLALSAQQRVLVSDALSNDEDSSDDEMRTRFIEEFGLTDEQADTAMGYRPIFATNPLYELFPETVGRPA